MSLILPRKGLEAIKEYAVEQIDADIFVNANECNWPLPEAIQAAIAKKAETFGFNRYPPMQAEGLSLAIAEDLGLARDNVKIGNGSSDLLQAACYAFGGEGRKIAFPRPSFSMYEVYARLADSEPLPYELTEDGFVDAESVIALCAREKPALLIVCNPNNPTGNYNSVRQMEKIIAGSPCPVIMDEAYMEFAGGHDAGFEGSTLKLLKTYDSFLCLRTFSKAYGLAALRVGYAAGGRELQSVLGRMLLPYHVNAFSLLAAELVYRQKEEFVQRTKLIVEEREKMRKALADMDFQVWDSATNFLLFRAKPALAERICGTGAGGEQTPDGQTAVKNAGRLLFTYLAAQRILTRDFSQNELSAGAIRLTMGTPDENAIISESIREFCKKARVMNA
ncbi:MAG: aminotransferase class I/II-fold pyridoxal phosphate-dependent enzyme [Acholeplasmataceae bacterium]|nr:aminotransferase class I/II-fold pyridoxal phosphate-dependent enzyme [Acholeplasmataceae bacterium]